MNATGNNPLLLLLIGVPLIGAVAMMFCKNLAERTAKLIALVFALIPLVLAVFLWIAAKKDLTNPYAGLPNPTAAPPDSFSPLFSQTFSADWIPSFGIRFSLGVDGISLVMIALITLLVPIVLGACWEEKLPAGRSVAGYFGLLLALEGAMIGVFAATDVFLFYVMFEVMLIPMYFLVGAYGGVRRAYAATKFFLYSLLGGLLMLASVIGLYVASADIRPEGGTLDFAELRAIAHQIPLSTQLWIFGGFAIAFAIKAPLVPLHTWLPDAGAEAPIGAGTLLVGVLDKVGTFGFLRICLPLLPLASAKLAWLIILLAVIGIIYGAIVAAGQTDLKRFVTYTSIAHFGFIALGCFVFTTQAVSGAVFYMVNHGLATGLLFLVVGMLTARGGSRLISDYGGVWKVAPLLGGLFLIASFATIAVPGTNSFVSEFLVLIGSFRTQPVWAIIATTGIILAAVYMLWVFQQVFTGPVRGRAVVGDGGAVPDGALGPDSDATTGPILLGGGAAAGEGVSSAPSDDAWAVSAPSATLTEARTDPHGVPAVDPNAQTVKLGADTITAAADQQTQHPKPRVKALFGDLSKRELLVLSPLAALIILLGVYPKPVLDVINPTAVRTVIDSGHVDPSFSIPEAGR
ncbi:complex I subunit 4 family protein [Nakamurella lactea]|uniref:complex I subunit 4 family protein n=1 Tax=Nakamurella lactea TaxID=459515 RepID=UPI00041F3AEE|nr:NADH-quinone oxidoreductase subunit M [Nakamurella lactea]